MTGGMRFRLWLQDAPRSHVTVAGAVALILVLALVTISVPVNNHDKTLAAGPQRVDVAGANQARAAGAGTSADEAAPGATLDDGPRGPSVPAGAGVTSAATTGRAGGAGATAGATARPASPGTGAGARTASDVGISTTGIKVGFLIAQLGELNTLGFALGFRNDQEAAIKAFGASCTS
jgi:hypothetical protein